MPCNWIRKTKLVEVMTKTEEIEDTTEEVEVVVITADHRWSP
jgi:hypothetical protein